MANLIRESFSAWINKMPGGEHTLIAKGAAEVPTGGWKGVLTSADPQGINKDILILNVSLTPPSGLATEVISQIELRYEESPPKHHYSQVTFKYESEEFDVDVGVAE